MIKAVLKNGQIQPIDPLPGDWNDGLELAVEIFDDVTPNTADGWAAEVRAAMSAVPREDHVRLLSAIRSHQQEQKELMRRSGAVE